MMEIKKEDVEYLAKLGNVDISEEENARLQTDLKNILNYVNQLDEVDTDGVEPTYQVLDLKNVWREDELIEETVTPEQLIDLAPEKADRQIKVAKVL